MFLTKGFVLLMPIFSRLLVEWDYNNMIAEELVHESAKISVLMVH